MVHYLPFTITSLSVLCNDANAGIFGAVADGMYSWSLNVLIPVFVNLRDKIMGSSTPRFVYKNVLK